MTLLAISFAAIILPQNPSQVEKSAAAELEAALKRIGGAPASWTYYVGATEASRREFGSPNWREDEIAIRTAGNAVVLDGHPLRGPLYAVDSFLEDALGVRWWTSTETEWPKAVPTGLPALEIRYAPKIRYRETYYKDGFDPDFKVRLKGNFTSRTRYLFEDVWRIPPEKGGDSTLLYYEGRSSSYHSFFEVLPPARYFKDHPDWYSLVGGVREPNARRGQLCLTNPEMEREYVSELRKLLLANPNVDFVQVSQNDGNGACECARCRAVEDEEGGAHSAPLLRFVNRVAERLEKEFPRVMFDTFAYLYTRRPPTKTRPRHNVTVRLCDIECDFRKPLAELPQNKSFVEDLAGWKRIAAGRLYIWDYVTDFTSYMMPHPNFRAIGPNIRLFADSGAVGVFEQGDALCDGGEFWPLRQWVIGHLLWNPERDAEQLKNEFLVGYYGPSAGPVLGRYLDLLCDEAASGERPVGCYHPNVSGFLDSSAIRRLLALMDEAVAAADRDGHPYSRRVRREKLSTDHMRILNWKALGEQGDYRAAVEKWYADGDAYGVRAIRETTRRSDRADYKKELLAAGPVLPAVPDGQ